MAGMATYLDNTFVSKRRLQFCGYGFRFSPSGYSYGFPTGELQGEWTCSWLELHPAHLWKPLHYLLVIQCTVVQYSLEMSVCTAVCVMFLSNKSTTAHRGRQFSKTELEAVNVATREESVVKHTTVITHTYKRPPTTDLSYSEGSFTVLFMVYLRLKGTTTRTR